MKVIDMDQKLRVKNGNYFYKILNDKNLHSKF